MSLKQIERCNLPGKYKAWMLQHILLPRITYPLTIYNIPMTKVSEIQKQMTSKLKNLLGLPSSLSVESLYTKPGKLQLPFSELTEEVKSKVLVTLEESEDPCVRNAWVKIDGGTKADTPKSVKEAKSKLKMQEITEIANRGRQGIGLESQEVLQHKLKERQRSNDSQCCQRNGRRQEISENARSGKTGSPYKMGSPGKKADPARHYQHARNKVKIPDQIGI